MISILFALATMLSTMAILSAPFCALQLALCRFCPWRPLQYAPAVLSGAGFLWSWWYLSLGDIWGGMMLIFVTFPCTLGLIGSGAGWYIWKKTPH